MEVQARIHLYELSGFLNTGQFDKAKLYASEYNDFLTKKVTIAGPETQVKLYLQAAILHLCLRDITKARKSMKKILESGKSFHTLPSYKTARLINLVIQAESGNYDFFQHEINSIKRMIRFEKHIYITEKLLFRFLIAFPLPVFKKDKEKLWLQYQKEITQIRQDKYEKQLLKTFDFVTWIESNLTNSSYQEILLRIQKEKK